MYILKSVTAGTTVALVLGVLASSSWANSAQKNTTGLPTYPHDSGGTMDAVARSLPNGQHCTHYAGKTQDALATVIEWYKKALPGARVQDVNKDSLYGSYFKLEGVTLLLGHDMINVYRMPKTDSSSVLLQRADTHSTEIEIFKCNDAPQARE